MRVINFKFDAIQSVEIIVPGVSGGNTSQTFSFPDLPYLRPSNARIKGIELMTINTITKSPLSGTALVTAAMLQTSFLTLYGGIPGVKQGNEIIQRLALSRLNVVQNASTDPFVPEVMPLNEMQVDWTKSNVYMQTAPGNTTAVAFVFNVYFDFIETLPQY
jgi:hypothetical protein